jgi:hypothetical protein
MTFGLIANGVANLIKMFASIKNFFNKTGSSTADLGETTEYMTQAQLEAQAVAAAIGGSVVETGNTIPAQEYTQPIAGGRNCPHGRMTAIQGMGKDGKPYKGYFCPAPKGAFDKCKNQYVNMQSTEWNTFVPEQVK